MERCYLRAWKIFKEKSSQLLPQFIDLVREDKELIKGQLYALNALGAMRVDEPKLRAEIV
jgi:hypothetical protein